MRRLLLRSRLRTVDFDSPLLRYTEEPAPARESRHGLGTS